jgi:pimeloyl-ACP methyl ester carboxylesterase
MIVACGVALVVGTVPSQAEALTVTTSSREKKRVDKVSAKITWNQNCGTNVKCGYIKLPLDYDSPKGAKVTVRMARYRYPGQTNRIGTLFVNFGGPGVSGITTLKSVGTAIANNRDTYFPIELLKRFDIVAIDPRGVGQSDTVQCFKSYSARKSAVGTFATLAFPTKSEVSNYLKGARNLAKGCSSTAKSKASAMSTAEVARDLDVIRRAVGDSKLSYLGFSYGSYLGEVYAALFPDRIRVMALDGVIDPLAWRGTATTKNNPITLRLKSGEATYEALFAALSECQKAGAAKCPIMPNPWSSYQTVVNRLKSKSVTTSKWGKVTYASFIKTTANYLRDPDGAEDIADMVAKLLVLTNSKSTSAQLKAADAGLPAQAQGSGFAAYNTYDDSYYSVMCSDSANPSNPSIWTSKISNYRGAAKDFVTYWGWNSAPCAALYWKAKDEDRFTGSFSVRPSYPILAVSTQYDPVTSHWGAKTMQRYFRNTRLLVNAGYGHMSYIYSDCIKAKVNNYLISRTLPANNTTCANENPIFK